MNLNFNDITNQKFGRLTASVRVGSNKHNNAIWKCVCDCGNEIIVIGSNLTNGHTQSCGCLQKDIMSKLMKKQYGESAFTQLFNQYKSNAKNGVHEFSLLVDEFKDLTSSNCAYCGKSPTQIIHKSFNNGDYVYNGIDRIDNTKGYIKGNVRTSCGRCNYAKRNYTEEEFIALIKIIHENHTQK